MPDRPDAPPPTDSEVPPREAGAKRPGHGRIPAAAYTGATRVTITHPTLHSGDGRPGCRNGTVYPLAEPGRLVRITGVAPLGATVYECVLTSIEKRGDLDRLTKRESQRLHARLSWGRAILPTA